MIDQVESLRARSRLLHAAVVGLIAVLAVVLPTAVLLGMVWLSTKGVVGVECGKGGKC